MAGRSLVELPPQTIRLLGSGQVITSVYSVVKELVENSCDAGCTSIDIKLENYGLEKIEISDNGHGIKAQDVPYVAKRHYTSKLVTTDDMQSLETYGFRGEALASLCAVSQVTIATKTAEDEVSNVYDFDSDGNITGKKPSYLGTGTTITVRHLFSNLPVRKQYYIGSQRKKDDLKKIEDLLIAFGIIRPQLRISLRHDRDVIWQKIQTTDVKGSLQSVLSRQVFNQLLFEEKHMEELQGSLCAYLPKPGSDLKLMSRSTSDRTFTVVNERPVYIKELVKLVKQYYCNCHGCDTNRFPICYIHIKLPTADVDVNIDPNKTTVLLKNLHEVRTSLEEMLLKIYGPLDNVPSWHYSETAKMTQEQKTGTSLVSVVSSAVDRKSLGKAVGDEMRCQTTSNLQYASKTLRQTDVARPQRLPSFTVTFHSSEMSSAISNEMDVNTENLKHRNSEALSSCSSEMTNKIFINNNNKVNDCSKLTTNIDNTLENINSFPHSTDVQSESYIAKSLCDPSSSVISLQFGNYGTMIEESGTSLLTECSGKLPENCDTDQTLDPDIANKSTDDIQVSTEIETAEIGKAWSMGHGVKAASGDHLQPVRLLSSTSAEIPRKRLSSSLNRSSSGCPAKARKMSVDLAPDQLTLTDLVNQVKKAASCELIDREEMSIMLESSTNRMAQRMDEKLQGDCQNLSANDEVTFGKESLQDKQSKVKNQKKNTRNSTFDAQKSETNVKTSDKKTLKKRLYHCEKNIDCCVEDLRTALLKLETKPSRTFRETPVVIGQAESCDAWFCSHGDKLCLVNLCRLGEAVLYRKLKNKHRLPVKLWQSPIDLDMSNIQENLWQTLEQLARSCETRDTYFHISDERIVANGFDIQCHRDSEGNLQAKLVGMCDLIPAYRISDLHEVLETISNDPQVTVGGARPTKVLYYLQGEVYRMLQATLNNASVTSVQEMINQLVDGPDVTFCIHQRPVFHYLYDFSLTTVSLS